MTEAQRKIADHEELDIAEEKGTKTSVELTVHKK